MNTTGIPHSGRSRPLIGAIKHESASNVEIDEAYLKRVVPFMWEESTKIAKEVIDIRRDPVWYSRLHHFDHLVWHWTREMLHCEQITAVINRLKHSHGRCYALQEYVSFVSATSAVILEPAWDRFGEIDGSLAIFLSLACAEDMRRASKRWIANNASDPEFQSLLAEFPGASFAMLAVHNNDCAESFLARDAFFKAIQGLN